MGIKTQIAIENEILDELAISLSSDEYRGLNLDNPTERLRFVLRQFILAEKGKKGANGGQDVSQN